MKSIILAFSTYTKVPMPRVEWDEKSMKYMIAAFPLTGIVVGFIQILCCIGMQNLFHFSHISIAGLLTVLPLLITGGIHMDGYLDTSDALNSFQDKEKRLSIMKDPHIGGFAVIRMAIYLGLYFVFAYELILSSTSFSKLLAVWGVSFILSRCLSAIGVTHIQKAKSDGMVNDISKDSNDLCRYIIYAELFMVALAMVKLSIIYGFAAIIVAGITFLYYRYMCKSKFGGVTGDLSGWFLQVCELVMLIALVIMSKL